MQRFGGVGIDIRAQGRRVLRKISAHTQRRIDMYLPVVRRDGRSGRRGYAHAYHERCRRIPRVADFHRGQGVGGGYGRRKRCRRDRRGNERRQGPYWCLRRGCQRGRAAAQRGARRGIQGHHRVGRIEVARVDPQGIAAVDAHGSRFRQDFDRQDRCRRNSRGRIRHVPRNQGLL